MGAVKDGLPAAGQLLQQVLYADDRVGVEAGQGFVQEDQFGIVQQAADEEYLLLHALAEGVDALVRGVLQVKVLFEAAGALESSFPG